MSPLALYIPMVLFFGWAGIDTQTLSPQPSAITGISLNFTSVGDSNVVDLRRVAEQPAHDVCFAAPSCACVLGLSLAAARDTNYPKRHPYDNVRRPRVMGDIALALSLGGDAEGSRKTFEEALKAVSQIEKPSDRISALLDLPRKLAKAGDVNGALDVTSQIDDPRSRGEALLGISEE